MTLDALLRFFGAMITERPCGETNRYVPSVSEMDTDVTVSATVSTVLLRRGLVRVVPGWASVGRGALFQRTNAFWGLNQRSQGG